MAESSCASRFYPGIINEWSKSAGLTTAIGLTLKPGLPLEPVSPQCPSAYLHYGLDTGRLTGAVERALTWQPLGLHLKLNTGGQFNFKSGEKSPRLGLRASAPPLSIGGQRSLTFSGEMGAAVLLSPSTAQGSGLKIARVPIDGAIAVGYLSGPMAFELSWCPTVDGLTPESGLTGLLRFQTTINFY